MAKATTRDPETPLETGAEAAVERADGKSSTLPRPSSKRLTPEDFWAYTQKLTPTDWAHAVIYIYRHFPVIIKEEPKYIDCLSEPIDEQYMLTTHGSGEYQLMLNDRDRRITVCETFPTLRNASYEPQINLQELDVENKRNRTFVDALRRMGKLDREGNVVTPNGPAAADTSKSTEVLARALVDLANQAKQRHDPTESAFPKVVEMLASAGQKSVEMALSQVKERDPAEFLKLITTVIALVQPKSEGESPLLKILLADQQALRAELAEERKANRELMSRILDRKDEKTDPLEMVDRVLGIRERLAGADLGGSPDWKAMGMGLVAQNGPAVGRLFDALAVNLRGRQQPAATGTASNVTGPTVIAPAEPTTTPNPSEPPQDPQLEYLKIVLSRYGHYFVNAFAQGQNGQDFAGAIVTFTGQLEYEKLQNCGKAKLVQALQFFPELWSQLQMVQPQLEVFIDDFLIGPFEEEEPPPEAPKKRKPSIVPTPGAAA